jgi:peroxiredoxin
MRGALLISSLLMLMAPAVQAAPPSAKIPKQLAESCRPVVEDAGFVTPEGKKIALSEVVAGRPTALVIIKGYWCPVCQEQLASSTRQLAKLEAKGAAIIGLSTEDAGTNRMLMKRLRLDFPIYGEPSARLLERLGFWSKKNGHPIPGILFLDRCGDVAYRYFGRWPGRGQDALIEKTLDQLLRAPARCGDA